MDDVLASKPAGAAQATDLLPAKLAAKYAIQVYQQARLALGEPDRKGRLDKIKRMMARTDAIAGVEPAPGTPELGVIGSAAFHHALAAFYRRHRRLDQAIEACQAGVALHPGDIALRGLWLETLNSAGRLKEAGPLLQLPKGVGKGSTAEAARQLLQRAEELLLPAGENELVLDAIEQMALLGAANPGGVRALIRRAQTVPGGTARLASYRAQIQATWSSNLPERLADGLEALKRETTPVPLPEPALAWAWALADQNAWSHEEWRRAVDWGGRAAALLLKWWFVRPERSQEIAELVDAPDLAPIRAGHSAGRAQIIAAAHVGPTLGAFNLLESSQLPFRTLGGTALVELSGEAGSHIGSRQKTSMSRELIEAVRRASVIAITADVAIERDWIELDFLGRKVAIKSLPATLAQRYGCDTWWCQSLWQGDRIVVEFNRLPSPEADEPPAEWAQRWGRAYLKRLKPTMRGDPRNLSLTTGIWRFAGR
jgi:hypothetical protein